MNVIKLTFSLLLVAEIVSAQQEVYTQVTGEAIQGYDPVAYFKESQPVKGKKEFSYEWSGATWHFSNQENANTFKASPEKFAPQFGGYCAYGVAKGYKASTSPDAWSIVDNKLYLNYDNRVKNLWNKNQSDFIQAANANWITVKKN